MLRQLSLAIIVCFAALCSAQGRDPPPPLGVWSNETLMHPLWSPQEAGWSFRFQYGLIPKDANYYYALEFTFPEIVEEFEVVFASDLDLPEFVSKEKSFTPEAVLHTRLGGDQNDFSSAALHCGVMKGVVKSKTRPLSVKSALFLITFATPDACSKDVAPDQSSGFTSGWAAGHPMPNPTPHHSFGYLPPIVAALISFFATIGGFLVLAFCCCMCCRIVRGARCKRSKSCHTDEVYPSEQETAAEYAAVPTEEVAPTQPQQFVVPMIVNGETMYVQVQVPMMMYPQSAPINV